MMMSNNSSQSSVNSQRKLKIKCHYTDTRILLTSTDINFNELRSRISEKFKSSVISIQLAYKDEEQQKVLNVDDENLELAKQMNRKRYNQTTCNIEKLEIWL
jgi:5S rRNA maturation endonuclease (ribonuclease M5)